MKMYEMTRAQIQFSYQTEIQFENERGEISSNREERGKGKTESKSGKKTETPYTSASTNTQTQ